MKALAEQIGEIDGVNIYGRVVGVRGLMVEIAGPIHAMSVGARIVIETGGNRFIPAEVIGFSGSNAVAPSSPPPPARCGRHRAGSAALSMPWGNRSTARGP
jgi:flagellar biosynthesis/type III secretory pathway ATPase